MNDAMLSGLEVLVVDESAANLEVVTRALEPEGYRIAFARDAEGALSTAARLQPDLILLDLMLAGDGIEACRRLKAKPETTEIPVIFVTERSDAAKVREWFEIGAIDYISKPIHEGEVCSRVNAHLRSIAYLNRLNEEVNKHLVTEKRLRASEEMATAAIHNIRNTLGSVHVSTHAMMQTLNRSRLQLLSRITGTLISHQEDIEDFTRRDPKGKDILELQQRVCASMANEHDQLKQELKDLTKHIARILRISSAQQDVATRGLRDRLVPLRDLIEDSLQLQLQRAQALKIRVDVNYRNEASLLVPELGITQVIMNLLKNARESLATSPQGTRRLAVTVFKDEQERVNLRVADTGAGISPENLHRMFTRGFTTKETGHGFGLNFCRKAMEQLGGALEATSEGEGKGATFTLVFPLELKTQREVA